MRNSPRDHLPPHIRRRKIPGFKRTAGERAHEAALKRNMTDATVVFEALKPGKALVRVGAEFQCPGCGTTRTFSTGVRNERAVRVTVIEDTRKGHHGNDCETRVTFKETGK